MGGFRPLELLGMLATNKLWHLIATIYETYIVSKLEVVMEDSEVVTCDHAFDKNDVIDSEHTECES